MADLDDRTDTKEFYLDIPARNEAFFLKGSGALDWGMQNRLAHFQPHERADRHVGHRPRILPGPHDRPGAG